MLNDNTGDDHGTHVAGLIAATDNTVGIRGVADQVQILGIDWRDEDTGSMFSDCDIVAWIKMAIENGAKVTNLSLGITYPTDYQYYSEIHGELWAIVSYLEDFGYGL